MTTNDQESPRTSTNDHEWPRMKMSFVVICGRSLSFVKIYTNDHERSLTTTNDNVWPRTTMNNHKWPRMTTNEKVHSYRRVTNGQNSTLKSINRLNISYNLTAIWKLFFLRKVTEIREKSIFYKNRVTEKYILCLKDTKSIWDLKIKI